jgi:hypothetical protein
MHEISISSESLEVLGHAQASEQFLVWNYVMLINMSTQFPLKKAGSRNTTLILEPYRPGVNYTCFDPIQIHEMHEGDRKVQENLEFPVLRESFSFSNNKKYFKACPSFFFSCTPTTTSNSQEKKEISMPFSSFFDFPLYYVHLFLI